MKTALYWPFLIMMLWLLAGCGAATPAASTLAPATPTPPTVPPPTATAIATTTAPPPVPTATSLPAATATAPASRAAGWAPINAVNSGPSPRYDQSALVDPVRQQLVVFGGRGNGTFGDTWILDFATRQWREVKGLGPAPRFGQAVVYDAAHRRMLLVMGEGANFFNDVWAFDLDKETWASISASAVADNKPRPRYGQSAALDGKGRVIISHVFSDQGRFDDTWAFDSSTAQWSNLTPASGPKPLRRCLHELVYDSIADRVLMFGGCSSGFGPCPQGDLWAFDLKSNTWSELKPSGPAPTARSNPSMIYDAAGKRMVLFGGKTEGGASAELWSYDLSANRWVTLGGAGPGARSSQSASYDAKNGRVVIFGGQVSGNASADIWEYRF
ncbi:MAG: hypothetical protein HY259_13860 [Chloroflexi bacterium]|nr:hypothetical protein [Chloroflexota bacterium]